MEIGDAFEGYVKFKKPLNVFKKSNLVDYCIIYCKTLS